MQTSVIQHRSIGAEYNLKSRGHLLLWQLLKVQDVVDAHLSEYISSGQLADCARLSRYHFARAFRRSTGMSPQGYVIRRRLERAQYLMLWTEAPLSGIAFDCGFSDQSHFSRVFVKTLGETPRSWRTARLASTHEGRKMSAPSDLQIVAENSNSTTTFAQSSD
jgi:AraC family transcriptional regulator